MPVTVGAPPAPQPAPGMPGALGEVIPITVPLIAAGFGQQVFSGTCRFCGWSLIEPSGATPATVELYDGFDVRAQLLAVVNLPVGGAAPSGMSHDGIECREGMFLSVVAGSARGVIWARVHLS
ncbi:MAG TPA: hypothetical protein VHQ90_00070 [Thermoanaerobaculia bacterium]|nr:hypothetical protein [Thermoanaerobaculia bacterium]